MGCPRRAWMRPKMPLDPRALCLKASGNGVQLLPRVGRGDGSGPGLWSVGAAITDPTDGWWKQWIFSLKTLETGSMRSGCWHGRLLLLPEGDSMFTRPSPHGAGQMTLL